MNPVVTDLQLYERRQALAGLSRADLEARYRALPGREGRTTLSDRALIDFLALMEDPATRERLMDEPRTE